MNCRFDRQVVSLYADGRLTQEQVADVETHISECEECQQELEVIREMGKALNSLPRESAPRALIERIIAEAEVTAYRTTWDTVMKTVSTVWTVAKNGFRIEDDREGLLRREVPEWVARWVLFV